MALKLNPSRKLLEMDHETLLAQKTTDYTRIDDKIYIASAVAEAQPKPPEGKKPANDSHERELVR